MKRGKILQGYSEGNIDFAPTYKYLPGTNDYSCEEAKQKKRDLKHGIIRSEKRYDDKKTGKERIPSWTDRIFYRCNIEGLKFSQLFYGRTESTLSDHKPVSSVFSIPSENSFEDDHDDHQPKVTGRRPPPPKHLFNKTVEQSESIPSSNKIANRNSTITKTQLLSLDDFFSDEDASSSVTPLSDTDDGVIQPSLPPIPVLENPPPIQQSIRPVQQPIQQSIQQPQVSRRNGSRPELPQVPQVNQQQVVLPPLPQVNQIQPILQPQKITPRQQQQQQKPIMEDFLPPPMQPVIHQAVIVQSSQPAPSPQRQPVVMRPNMKDMRQAQRQQQPAPQRDFDPFEDDNFEWDLPETTIKPATQFYSVPKEEAPQQQFQQPPLPPKRSVRGLVQQMNEATTTGRPLPRVPSSQHQ
jgi:hypothetical protein